MQSFGAGSAGSPPQMPLGWWGMPHVNFDRGIRIDRIQVQVVKAGGSSMAQVSYNTSAPGAESSSQAFTVIASML